MPLNPFDWDAGPFLILYAVAIPFAAACGWLLPKWHRPAGRRRPVTDVAELAMLTRGLTRLAEVRVVERLEAGSLRLANKRFHATIGLHGGFGDDPEGGTGWAEMRDGFIREARTVRRRLVADGLMMDDADIAHARRLAMFAPAAVLLLGTARLVLGVLRGRPIGLLLLLMVGMLAIAAILWSVLDRRTQAGRLACMEASRASDRVRRAPTRSEIPLAVALFGTGVLAASHLSHFHQLRSNGGNDGGSGCGSDDGGGGCGGCGGD